MKEVKPKSIALMLAALAASLNACAAPAESDVADLELAYGQQALVSIATGAGVPLRHAPAVATVITAEDIAAMGALDLDEVLEAVPGLHVARSTLSSSAMYVIRGIDLGFNPQVLVLVNGVPQTIAYTGNRGDGPQGLPLDNIARVEVIRGPGSALYGADAFAGVINVITKQADDMPGTQVGARAGTYNMRDGWISHGGYWGQLGVAAYLRRGHTDGANPTITTDAQSGWDALLGGPAVSKAPGPANNQRDFSDGSLELSYEHWHASLGFRERSNIGMGTGVASALDPVGRSSTRNLSASLAYDQPYIGQDLALSVSASWMHFQEFSELTLFPAGFQGFYNDPFQDGMIGNPYKWERHFRLNGALTYSGWARHRLVVGAGSSHASLYKVKETKNFNPDSSRIGTGSVNDVIDVTDTVPFVRPHDRDAHYLVTQDEWNFADDWTLTAGLRQDHYSDFGATTNPRVALVWDAAYDLTAKLLYGTAFRTPSFAELYAINNPVVTGNPALSPEKIRTLEAALAWQAGQALQLGVNVFRYDMRDIIHLVNFRYENAGRQTGTGLELEARWDISPAWQLSGNYSYQFSRDEATGQDAGNAPHHHVYARLDWRMASGWRAHAQLNQISDRARVAGDTRQDLAGYATVDLGVRTTPIRHGWGIALSVHNLLNADVREPSPYDRSAGQPFISIPDDFPQAGRTWLLQASYTF